MNDTGSALSGIPALSIKQPWAELILSGEKTIEIRKWSTEYRGPVWLHTGLNPDETAMIRFGLASLFTGGFVGLITISDVLPFDSERWVKWRPRHLDWGPAGIGFLAWLLSKMRDD
jgi:ASCH domain